MAVSVYPIRLLIAAGGTGGHVYPGIAIAEEWKRLHPDSTVTFVGTERGVESKAVPAAGFEFRAIDARGFPRTPGIGQIRALWAFGRSFVQVAAIIKEVKPDAVIATGGFVSGPVGLWARLLSIPLVLQEQNSVPGAVNRWLSLIANQVHISFVESRNYFRRRNNLKVSGNPIRSSLLKQDRESAYEALGLDPARRTLLVFGGSRGAASINRAVLGALAKLSAIPNLQILWQTGTDDFEAASTAARGATIPTRAFAYLDRMEKAYAVADLAVCRSGAMTITELTACGVPAILIPYPHAARDHQTQNARGLVDRGAAEMVADKDLTPESLAEHVVALFRDESRLRRMGRNARAFSRTNAAERIVRSIEELVAVPVPAEDVEP
ncbi:MAG: undecaprenyldiphospho-muramoylpentapeptide beta-N-acetylglucosaminyltransferase [Candidatus Eiseniibacteriota bacterium]